MNHVIITVILLALAAKAKAQPKDNFTNQERGEKSDGNRGAPIKGRTMKKKSSPRRIRRKRTKIGLNFQSRCKNIHLDNKTCFGYPQGYCLC